MQGEGGGTGAIIRAGLTLAEAAAWVRGCHEDFARVPVMALENALRPVIEANGGQLSEKHAAAINAMTMHYAGARMPKPCGHLLNFLEGRAVRSGGRRSLADLGTGGL